MDRRLPSGWSSTSGTASTRRRHITNRRLGMTLRHNVTKQSRQYGGTLSNRRIKRIRTQLHLTGPPHLAASSLYPSRAFWSLRVNTRASNTIHGEHHESSQLAESIYNHSVGLRIIAGQRDCPAEISKGPNRWFVDAGPGGRHTPRRH